ncbi:restriction endonuclease subunit S [Paenarthrobacter nicotinovorans]|uniref:restriction endonuclease subunit S n=1 Tax=Paenarthrobacter nicotinovorans TaxID=29320 RepID=UPI003D676633
MTDMLHRVDTRSAIGELIAALCPQGVQFTALEDIADTVSGLNGKSKIDFSGGSARYVSYKNAFANLAVDQEAQDFVQLATGERQNQLREGDIVFTGSSESLDEVGMSSVVLIEPEEPLYLNSFCFAVRLRRPEILDPRFSMYLFRSTPVRRQICASASGVTRINVSKRRFMKTRVPLPPLRVQHEIVRILDSFTKLEAELELELDARQRQRLALARTLPNAPYSLAPGPNTSDLVRLGDVATQYVSPLRVQPDIAYTNLGVKWYGEGAFAREPKPGSVIKGKTLYKVKPQQFIYNRMFVTEGSFAVVTPELANGVVSNEFPVYDLDTSRVLPEWLLLYFKDAFTLKRIEGEVTGTERGSTKSRRRWKEDQFESFEIELPSIPAQQEVLKVIGTASALEAALNDELTLRRRQYEYYRDRLLEFVEVTS